MNDFVTSMITTVSIAIILPVVFNVFYFLKRKEEKKSAADNVNSFRTRAPKVIKIFFLAFAIIFFAVGIIGAIIAAVDGAGTEIIAILIVICTIIAIVGLIGYLDATLDYIIIGDDEVTIMRFFKKSKKVRLSEIRYYTYIESIYGGVVAYDKNGKVIFREGGLSLNLDKLVQTLDANYISRVPKFPPEELKVNPVYKRYAKKHSLIIYGCTLCAVGAVFLGMFALVFLLNKEQEFENHVVKGTISEYKFSKDFCTFKLKEDENTYCISNLYYDELNYRFESNIKEGEAVELIVGYTDDDGRRYVTQFEMNGKIYLYKADAEKAVTDNHKVGLTLSWVFLGISCASFAVSLPCLVFGARIKVEND